MSFASYNIPVTSDGTLPVKIFDRELSFKGMQKKKIPWLLCYGEDDDLVEKETALAPLDYIDVEIAPFPKGHVAIATSWAHPESECALHTRFGPDNRYRGPVRFQLDLNETLETSARTMTPEYDTTHLKKEGAKTKSIQKEPTKKKSAKKETANKKTVKKEIKKKQPAKKKNAPQKKGSTS